VSRGRQARDRDQIVEALPRDGVYAVGQAFANAITEAERAAPEAGLVWARREAVEMLARLGSPMMP